MGKFCFVKPILPSKLILGRREEQDGNSGVLVVAAVMMIQSIIKKGDQSMAISTLTTEESEGKKQTAMRTNNV